MANAKDITSESSNILIIGDGGTRKTAFLGSVPGIYIFDFDKGMATVRGRDIEYGTFKEVPKGIKVTPKQTERDGLYEFGHAWPAFFKKLQEIGTLIDQGKGPKAIGFDSLTMLSMIAVNKILLDTNQPSPHQGTWGAHHEYFKTIFGQVTAWPIRVLATAHVHRAENDLTQMTEKLPLLAGKLAGLIGVFFDEVYYTQHEIKDGKYNSTLITSQTGMYKQAKTRWGVPNNTETDWRAVEPFFNITTPPEVPLTLVKK